MEQSEKQAFWRFAVRYNGLLLGGLYFAMLGIMTLAKKGRMEGEMGYLFGAPFILTFVTLDIIEMILLLTRL